jgi:hypothetical protein
MIWDFGERVGYLCSSSLRYLATASRMRYDREGTLSFAISSSILSRMRIGRVAVMLAILFDLLPSIAMAFSEWGIIRQVVWVVDDSEVIGALPTRRRAPQRFQLLLELYSRQ